MADIWFQRALQAFSCLRLTRAPPTGYGSTSLLPICETRRWSGAAAWCACSRGVAACLRVRKVLGEFSVKREATCWFACACSCVCRDVSGHLSCQWCRKREAWAAACCFSEEQREKIGERTHIFSVFFCCSEHQFYLINSIHIMFFIASVKANSSFALDIASEAIYNFHNRNRNTILVSLPDHWCICFNFLILSWIL